MTDDEPGEYLCSFRDCDKGAQYVGTHKRPRGASGEEGVNQIKNLYCPYHAVVWAGNHGARMKGLEDE